MASGTYMSVKYLADDSTESTGIANRVTKQKEWT